MLDRGTLGPLDAHLLEEDLPVAFLIFLTAVVRGPLRAVAEAAHRLDFLGRGGDALDERLGDVVLARQDFGGGHVLLHDHDDGIADDELVVDRIADELQRLVDREVARGNRRNRRQPVAGLGGVNHIVAGEVVRLLRGRGLRLDGALRRLEVEVEAALLNRNLRVVVVLRRGAEEVHRLDDRRRRLKRDGRQANRLHAALDLLLDRALGIVTRRRLDRFGRRVLQLRGIGRVDRTPPLVDVGDHAVARRDALALENDLALALNLLAQTNRLAVVLVFLEDDLALLRGPVQVLHRQILAAAPQVPANLLALLLVFRIIPAVEVLRHIRLLLGAGSFRIPKLQHATGLRMTHVDRLLNALVGQLATTEVILLQRRTIETFGNSQIALLAESLRGLTVVQELERKTVMTDGLIILLARHVLARQIDFTLGLNIQCLAADQLRVADVLDEFGIARRNGRGHVGLLLDLLFDLGLGNRLLDLGLGHGFSNRFLGLRLGLRLSRLFGLGNALGLLLGFRWRCSLFTGLGLEILQKTVEIILRDSRDGNNGECHRDAPGDYVPLISHIDHLLLRFANHYTISCFKVQGLTSLRFFPVKPFSTVISAPSPTVLISEIVYFVPLSVISEPATTSKFLTAPRRE